MKQVYLDNEDTLTISESVSNVGSLNISDTLDLDESIADGSPILNRFLEDSLSLEESAEYVSEFKLSLSDEVSVRESVIDVDDDYEAVWVLVRSSCVVHAGI